MCGILNSMRTNAPPYPSIAWRECTLLPASSPQTRQLRQLLLPIGGQQVCSARLHETLCGLRVPNLLQ